MSYGLQFGSWAFPPGFHVANVEMARSVPAAKLPRADGARVIPGYLSEKKISVRGGIYDATISTGGGASVRTQLDALKGALAQGPANFYTDSDRYYRDCQATTYSDTYEPTEFNRMVSVQFELITGDPFSYSATPSINGFFSGTANNGTYEPSGSPAYVADNDQSYTAGPTSTNFADGLSLDGAHYVSVSPGAWQAPTGPWSISTRIKMVYPYPASSGIVTILSTACGGDYLFDVPALCYLAYTGGEIVLYMSTGASSGISVTGAGVTGHPVNDGFWHTLLATYSAGTLTLTIDGVSQGTASGTFFNEAATSIEIGAIGTAYWGGSNGGGIDEVAFFSAVQPSGGGSGPTSPFTGTETGLTFLAHFDDNLNDTSHVHTVINEGNAYAQPQLAMTMDGTGTIAATVTNITTGEAFTLFGPVTSGQVIVVDSLAESVTIAGVDAMSLFEGIFPRLAVGTNQFVVVYNATGISDFIVTWSNRWY